MSQQGADDWWQKLYEDPDAGADPDPGDTLDHRFRSAAVLTTPPTVPPQPIPGAGEAAPPPARAAAPPADRAKPPPPPPPPPTTQAEPDLPPPPPPHPPAEPPAEPGPTPVRPAVAGPPPPPPMPRLPASGVFGPPGPPPPPEARRPQTPAAAGPPAAAPGPPAVAGPPPATPPATPPAGPAEAFLPGPRQGSTPAPPAPPAPDGPPPPPPAPSAAPRALPPPRDPRAGGATGYALGEVEVPPVPGPAPVREPGAPAPDTGRPEVRHLGDRAPTYAAEPGALPAADPAGLAGLTPDTVLDGARYGTYTLRAASLRGDSARYRGEPRRDHLLTARFGTGDDALVLVVLAGGDRAAPGAAEAAAELCRTVAAAVGRSQERLADDIRGGHREALRSGLQRLTDRGYGRLRAHAAELGLAEEAYTAGLRGLLLPVDPQCRTRVCFGSGAGGLFRLRAGRWQDLEPEAPTASEERDGDFRFRASVARPGDTLLLCSGGLAEPMREEAVLSAELAARWSGQEPPGLAAFLADAQLRLKGYADDRTAAAVWEA